MALQTSRIKFAVSFIILLTLSSITAILAHAAKAPVYYFIAHAGPGDAYWSVQAKAAEDAAKKLGVKLVFSAPERPGDVARQVELLNAAIASKPAGIATTIPDANAFSRPLQSAAKKDIPVVAVNTREEKRNPKALPYLAYVGMDELQAGRNVAKRALEVANLKKGATAVIANHQPGVMSLELRTKGIREILSQAGIKLETVDITSNPAKAMTILQSYLKAHPKTDVIFTLGPLGYTPAGKLLSKSGLTGKVRLVGFDIDPVGLDMIQKGVMLFTIDAQPYMQAFMAVNQLYLASKFQATPVDLDTGVNFLDKTNASSMAELIKKGFSP